ncbi:MAG: L-threonylcarbamoyladenylate synthase [Spirochaetota bacterium]
MNIVPANKENIRKAAGIIKSGGLVAFPTETVYGLGANALDPIAVSKIFEIKKRPFFDPLIVHIASLPDIEFIAAELGETEQKLAQKFWPGPLTLVLRKKSIIPEIVTAGLPTVAVRMPASEVARELISAAGVPIAAPSANLFGRVSPTKAEHVFAQLGMDVDLILDGGKCEVGIESTIVKIESGRLVLLRHGGLPVEEIEKATGSTLIIRDNNSSDIKNTESPGQLPYHYSPVTPIVLVQDIKNIRFDDNSKAGLLLFNGSGIDLRFKKVEILSETGNLREAAANLFSCMHSLDSAGLDIIYAETIPENGLGKAIMDRLTKAANKKKFNF